MTDQERAYVDRLLREIGMTVDLLDHSPELLSAWVDGVLREHTLRKVPA